MQTSKDGGARATRRTIKKYPNRRLYDTTTSSYVTQSAVRQLVVQGEPVVVRDAKTNEDLTRAVLLQIILEEEAGGRPMFSEQALASFIRFYGHAMQGFMGSYLEKNIQAIADMQDKLLAQSGGMAPESWGKLMNMNNPAMQGLMGNYLEQSGQAFTKMQEQMQKQTEQMLGAMGIKQ